MDGEKLTTAKVGTGMPTLFIPHGGGPCFFMEWSPRDTWDRMGSFLRGVADTLPARPKAIVLVHACVAVVGVLMLVLVIWFAFAVRAPTPAGRKLAGAAVQRHRSPPAGTDLRLLRLSPAHL